MGVEHQRGTTDRGHFVVKWKQGYLGLPLYKIKLPQLAKAGQPCPV